MSTSGIQQGVDMDFRLSLKGPGIRFRRRQDIRIKRSLFCPIQTF
jgi:hypothetical protein